MACELSPEGPPGNSQMKKREGSSKPGQNGEKARNGGHRGKRLAPSEKWKQVWLGMKEHDWIDQSET